MNLTWQPVSKACYYNLYATGTGLTGAALLAASTTTSKAVPANGTPQKYTFTVTSLLPPTGSNSCANISKLVESAPSSSVFAYNVSAPIAPTTTVGPGPSQITVNWTATAPLASSYTLLRSTDNQTWSVVDSNAINTFYIDTVSSAAVQYYYEVQANFNTISGGIYTGYALNYLTSPSSGPTTPALIIPPVPSGLGAIGVGGQVNLSWAPTQSASSYLVYQTNSLPFPPSPTPFATPTGYPSATPSYSVPVASLPGSQVQYFAVSAVNQNVQSALSAPVSLYPLPSPPPAPSVTPNPSGSPTIVVAWPTTPNATSYSLQRSTDGSNFGTTVTSTGNTTYTDTVTPGVQYWYQYLPIYTSGINYNMTYSAISPSVMAGYPPTAPTPLVATVTLNQFSGNPTVTLTWVRSSLPVSGNTVSYNIYRGTSSGGPYTPLTNGNPVADPTNQYLDSPPIGTNYYYVVTAVNSAGVNSAYSNEAVVNVAASSVPSNLTATAGTNVINLSWSPIASPPGGTVYYLRRGTATGGPYGVIASGNFTSYTDSNITNGMSYYYVVDTILPPSTWSANSNEATATASVLMNLEVPVELTDQSLSSSGQGSLRFPRTRTRLDPTAYDGTVTYTLEAVATNSDPSPYNISLVSSSGATITTLQVPASTTSATQLTTTFSPNGSADNYRLSIPMTLADNDLQILSARIRVKQVGATKSKVYIPLLASSAAASNGDLTAPVGTTTSSGYAVLPTGTIFQYEPTRYSQIPAFSPFELETLIATDDPATVGGVALYDTTRSAIVSDTESLSALPTPIPSQSPVPNPSPNITLSVSTFGLGSTNLSTANIGDQYQVAIQCTIGCTTGTFAIYKAGLWVNVSTLQQVR